jgi:hypothetical protein
MPMVVDGLDPAQRVSRRAESEMGQASDRRAAEPRCSIGLDRPKDLYRGAVGATSVRLAVVPFSSTPAARGQRAALIRD